jgi:hypothetical protein
MSSTTGSNRSPRDHSALLPQSDDEQATKTPKIAKIQERTFTVFPVGTSSYLDVNSSPNCFYIDKTSFIPRLEKMSTAVILLAPRSFGKSLLLDTLACYYDISRAETFEEDFGKRWIGQADEFEHKGTRPRKTELANKFYVLRVDFSDISQANSLEDFNKSLNTLINNAILYFTWNYPEVGNPPQTPKMGSFSL